MKRDECLVLTENDVHNWSKGIVPRLYVVYTVRSLIIPLVRILGAIVPSAVN